MNKKLVGILICMLLTTTSILPVVGTMNKLSESNILSSNISEIEWSRTYGGEEADKFWDVEETSDGGYIASGTTQIENNHCPWVVKVDSEGNEMWDWKITGFDYGGIFIDITYSWCDDVMQTSDGGYIIGITGFLFTYNGEPYGVGGLLKLDSNGGEEWLQIYGNTFETHIGVEFIQEIEDGFVCAGSYGEALGGNDPTRDSDICLFRTDSMGEIIWHQEYDYSDLPNWARGFCFTNDGGYLLAGQANVEDYDDWYPCMVKTDSNGNEEWHKIFGSIDASTFWNVYQTSDGGYIAGGGSNDLWIVKTDAYGDMMWNKSFGEKYTDYGWDFDETDDGGYIASVIIHLLGINTYSWVLKIDSNGNAEWKHIYGEGGGKNYFLAVCPTSDDGCIASGISGNWDSLKSDALLVKYAPMENQRPNKPSKPSGSPKGEPNTEYTFTTSTTDPDGDSLTYMWDWGDGNYSDWLESSEASHTWTTEDNFKIKVMAKDIHGGESEWSDPFVFSTPKNKVINLNLFLQKLFQRIPFFEKILNQII